MVATKSRKYTTDNTSLSIIAIIAAFALITASTFVTPALALKRYFNCVTEIANKAGQLLYFYWQLNTR